MKHLSDSQHARQRTTEYLLLLHRAIKVTYWLVYNIVLSYNKVVVLRMIYITIPSYLYYFPIPSEIV